MDFSVPLCDKYNFGALKKYQKCLPPQFLFLRNRGKINIICLTYDESHPEGFAVVISFFF